MDSLCWAAAWHALRTGSPLDRWDNYATHQHRRVRHWLSRHPSFHLQFTPTSSPWLNLGERFFADLTWEAVREGSFTTVIELVRAPPKVTWPNAATPNGINGERREPKF
jgi:hypothetical protein